MRKGVFHEKHFDSHSKCNNGGGRSPQTAAPVAITYARSMPTDFARKYKSAAVSVRIHIGTRRFPTLYENELQHVPLFHQWLHRALNPCQIIRPLVAQWIAMQQDWIFRIHDAINLGW